MELGRIGVLLGGCSGEREISLATGRAVCDALLRMGYDAVMLDVNPDIARLLIKDAVTVAFIALHGPGGEDGKIQGLLETMQIPYTGSGVLASAVAMDKWFTKRLLDAAGIRTPRTICLTRVQLQEGAEPDDELVTTFPVVVKPVGEGSTLGISVVKSKDELGDALARASTYGNSVLVEDFIPGRELSVGVLDGEPLPVIEIVTKSGFYDYNAKYLDSSTEYIVPAKLSGQLSHRLQQIACGVHETIGCSGATRVDFRVTVDEVIHVLEINTAPGMTPKSLLPKSALVAGIHYDQLVERILKTASLK